MYIWILIGLIVLYIIIDRRKQYDKLLETYSYFGQLGELTVWIDEKVFKRFNKGKPVHYYTIGKWQTGPKSSYKPSELPTIEATDLDVFDGLYDTVKFTVDGSSGSISRSSKRKTKKLPISKDEILSYYEYNNLPEETVLMILKILEKATEETVTEENRQKTFEVKLPSSLFPH